VGGHGRFSVIAPDLREHEGDIFLHLETGRWNRVTYSFAAAGFRSFRVYRSGSGGNDAIGGQTVLTWGAVAFGIGIALVILEIYVASKKKGGIQPQDKQRIWGLVWLSFFVSGLVMGLIWLA
jgi:hypothetical protein